MNNAACPDCIPAALLQISQNNMRNSLGIHTHLELFLAGLGLPVIGDALLVDTAALQAGAVDQGQNQSHHQCHGSQ